LATQCMVQSKPRSMRIRYEGQLGFGVSAKDLILGTLGQLGVGGMTGHVVEYAGPAIEGLSMEGRMTVCNMTIEGGGRAGMIAPDETTFAWFTDVERPGAPLEAIAVDRVFIGSCTNSRIGDLRAAAEVVAGRRVADRVSAMVVPGSQQVKAQAEAEGLDRVFRDAGFDWRVAGCSMCLGMNPDILQPGERCASTSNRNFEGRQGRGGLTHLVSPQMAAAAAIEGHFTDIRSWS